MKSIKQTIVDSGLDPGLCKLYLYAVKNSISTEFFPPEFEKAFSDDHQEEGEYAFDETRFEAFMVKWLDLWPKKEETGLEYHISGNGPECRKRMRAFIKNYKQRFGERQKFLYICIRVYEATKEYLESKKMDYSFTKKNVKFIQDNDGSVLEQWMIKKPGLSKNYKGI